MKADQGVLPLRERLRERDISITELASAVGYGREHIGLVVNGLRRPSAALRKRISAHLEVSEDALFASAGSPSALEQRIRDLVAAAPPLSEDQRRRLAAVLGNERVP